MSKEVNERNAKTLSLALSRQQEDLNTCLARISKLEILVSSLQAEINNVRNLAFLSKSRGPTQRN